MLRWETAHFHQKPTNSQERLLNNGVSSSLHKLHICCGAAERSPAPNDMKRGTGGFPFGRCLPCLLKHNLLPVSWCIGEGCIHLPFEHLICTTNLSNCHHRSFNPLPLHSAPAAELPIARVVIAPKRPKSPRALRRHQPRSSWICKRSDLPVGMDESTCRFNILDTYIDLRWSLARSWKLFFLNSLFWWDKGQSMLIYLPHPQGTLQPRAWANPPQKNPPRHPSVNFNGLPLISQANLKKGHGDSITNPTVPGE